MHKSQIRSMALANLVPRASSLDVDYEFDVEREEARETRLWLSLLASPSVCNNINKKNKPISFSVYFHFLPRFFEHQLEH